MIASQTKSLSFEEFLTWYPEDNKRYELIEDAIVEMLLTVSCEDVSGFLVTEFNFEIRKQNLPYSIKKRSLFTLIRNSYFKLESSFNYSQIS